MSFDPISAGLDFAGKVVDRIWPDATEKQKAEAAQIVAELTHEENIFAREVEDRASARNRESEIATSDAAPLLNKIVLPILAIGVMVLSFLLFYIVAFDSDVVTTKNKDVIIYILGVLSAIDTQIIQYYFGSSSGSVQKTDFMEKVFKK